LPFNEVLIRVRRDQPNALRKTETHGDVCAGEIYAGTDDSFSISAERPCTR